MQKTKTVTLIGKTILIAAFHPAILRNVLLSGVLQGLRTAGVRVVVLVPSYKKKYYEEELRTTGAIIEGIGLEYLSKQKLPLIMKRVSRLALDTKTARVEKRLKWKREGKFFYFVFASLLGKVTARSNVFRGLLRFIDRSLTASSRYDPIFTTYQPDMVLVTDVQNERDVEVLRNAKKWKIKTVAMVRNWDNLTSHGLIRELPSLLLVASPQLKLQAEEISGMPSSQIVVTGSPHYDRWFRGPTKTRKEFFEDHGFDNTKPLVLLALIGDWYIVDNDTDSYLLELAKEWSVNVMVRFHPTVEIKALRGAKPYPGMAFDRPGAAFDRGPHEERVVTAQDDEMLLCELAYSDVIVCGPTTLAMEAMVFDKPVVLVDFHRTERPFIRGITKYACDHFAFVLDHHAAILAKSSKELQTAVTESLVRPETLSRQRAEVVSAYAGSYDGRSGQRVVQAMLDVLTI